MTEFDTYSNNASKWNERYQTDTKFINAPVRSLIRSNRALLPESGRVLEIAGGMGKTADFLQQIGLDVVELDISIEALKHAKAMNPLPLYIVADVSYIPLSKLNFDIICNFYFLDRKIFPIIDEFLAPGGLLFFETLTIDMLTIKPDFSPERLLLPGELKKAFSSYNLLHYFEGWVDSDHGKRKAVAQLIARKPR